MFYVYVLLLNNDKYYYGYTSNLEQRINQHEDGDVKSTKNKNPKLLYKQVFETKTEAIKFEKYLKKSKNKDYIDKLFNNNGEVAKVVIPTRRESEKPG